MFFILHNTLIYKFIISFRLIFFVFQSFGCVVVFLSVVVSPRVVLFLMCCSFYAAVGVSDFMKPVIGWSVNDETEGMWKESVLK